MKLAPEQYILGISGGFHDAAATVIDRHGDIVFAEHSSSTAFYTGGQHQ
jgi:hypothetical protein